MKIARLLNPNSQRYLTKLPRRKTKDNKTHGGKTLIIAGSQSLFGAAVLAATAAARVGSGYTYLQTDTRHFPVHRHPDFLIKNFGFKDYAHFDAIAIGPGLGVTSRTEKILRLLLKLKIQNVVCDADALTVIAKKKIYPLPESWILTPHTGELSRLIGKQGSLKQAQKKYGCHILLKGAVTKIINSRSKIKVASGNSSLAKAGTGDVLTGVITGLLAQGLSPMQAASLGAFVHGQASQEWTKSGRDHLSLLASDLFEIIPKILHDIRCK